MRVRVPAVDHSLLASSGACLAVSTLKFAFGWRSRRRLIPLNQQFSARAAPTSMNFPMRKRREYQTATLPNGALHRIQISLG
jgi:hypothetical protein